MTRYRLDRALAPLFFTALLGWSLTGCLDRELGALIPCTVSGFSETIMVSEVEKVDLLFVIDNSSSMDAEQAALQTQFPRIFRVLTTGDINGDGVEDFRPVQDLQLGVISTDLGAAHSSCTVFGDDGSLQTSGLGDGCSADYPTFLRLGSEDGDAERETFVADAICMTSLGIDGCGYEQQLESMLKALTPSESPIRFEMNTQGQGDRANAGFVRPDSLLAIIVVTDEDDGSTSEPQLYADSGSFGTSDARRNIRSFDFPEQLHPTQRYVDGLLNLRRANPDLLIFASIAGIPVDLVGGGNPDRSPEYFASILNDERMVETVNAEGNWLQLTPSCQAAHGSAAPARRLVEVARDLEAAGANGIVQSICQEDFTPALNGIIEKIADVLSGPCLLRELAPDTTGRVNCELTETLPATGDFTTCASLAAQGRIAEPIRTERNAAGDLVEVCLLEQVVPDRTRGRIPEGASGWYYDDFSDERESRCSRQDNRITFTENAEPGPGALIHLECFHPALPERDPSVRIVGDICGDAANNPQDAACDCREGDCSPRVADMICDTASLTCQVPCANNAECRNRLALGGFICDESRARPICVNPVCG